MKAIGGYFELELRQGEHYHPAALRLNSARHCFEYILRARGWHKLYLPYYTCDVMLQPLQRLGVAWEFYSINDRLEPVPLPRLRADEAFVYTNYFGLKQDCMERLASHYGQQLIADNAQAFYAPALPEIDTFYSPRKFFGVPDGGYLYTDCLLEHELEQDASYNRMEHLLRRIDEGPEAGYAAFRGNSRQLAAAPICRMSRLTEALLANIDYEGAKKKRRTHYGILSAALGGSNLLQLPLPASAVPLVYPYLTPRSELRRQLIEHRIYVASYWPNVPQWCPAGSLEHSLAELLLSLPVDQRCQESDMARVLKIIGNHKSKYQK